MLQQTLNKASGLSMAGAVGGVGKLRQTPIIDTAESSEIDLEKELDRAERELDFEKW